MQLIDTKLAEKVFPFWIYKRVKPTAYREFVTYKIEYGYGYFLRFLKFQYAFCETLTQNVSAPQIKIEAYDNARFKARQPLAFDPALIATPGVTFNEVTAAPDPVDNDGYGYNFSCLQGPLNCTPLNWYYQYGDVIRVDITGQNLTPSANPVIIDVLLQGYYVPQEAFELWGGNE